MTDKTILTHFESLKLEPDEPVSSRVNSQLLLYVVIWDILQLSLAFNFISLINQVCEEIAEDEALKDDERDGNEVPLGKMIQRIKSQGGKTGKAKKKKSSLAEVNNAGNDFDILKMVREINLDNLGSSNKFESSNGHKHSPSKKINFDLDHQESKKRKTTDAVSVSVPKRRRSSSAFSGFKSPKSASKGSLRVSGDDSFEAKVSSYSSIKMDTDIHDSEGRKSMEKKQFKNSKSGLLAVGSQRRRTFSSKWKGKGSDTDHDDEANEVGESDDDEDMKVGSHLIDLLHDLHFLMSCIIALSLNFCLYLFHRSLIY